MEKLKNKTNLVTTHRGLLVIGQIGCIHVLQTIEATVRSVQKTNDVE